MGRAWGVAIGVLVALGAGIGAGESPGSRAAPCVAYVTGGAESSPVVWLAASDGRHAHRLGPGSQPLLAPDGSLVAASAATGLIVYPASGGAPRHLFDDAEATAVATAFSPDSRYLGVVLSSTDPASAASSGLAVVDTTTFASRILASGQIYGASFAPDGSDRIVYASAPSPALTAPVDVHVIDADGSRAAQLTRDGRSLNPVWGRLGIAFDRERLRVNAEPAYQVWLMAGDGTSARQLTALAVPPLREGLVPIDFDDAGTRLLAEYEGQDTSAAWLLELGRGEAAPLGGDVIGVALSRDGARVLVDRGGFLNAPDRGVVESLPLAGGPLRILVAHGSEPSWDA
jgi:hypothetical protein